MLNFNLLRVFYAVARTRSVVRAAEKLYISQPAVSSGLKKLQQRYGISLFAKEGRNLVLTKDGEQLLDIAEKIFAAEKEAEHFLASLENPQNITIHLGLVTLYERSGVPDIIEQFKSVNKKITLSIHSGNSKSLTQRLLSHEIDMAISSDVANIKFENTFFYKKHRIFLVVPEGHRLFGKRVFDPEALQNENVLLKEVGSAVRANVDNYIRSNNIRLNVFSELSNFDSMLDIMQNDNCIAFFPDDIVSHLHLGEEGFSVLEPRQPIEFSTYIYLRKVSSYPESIKKYLTEIIGHLKSA